MADFEAKLAQVYPALERFVKYRLNGTPDAEDILQEVCLAAYLNFDRLKDPEAFKPWLLTIARNRCSDYFRRRGGREVPLEEARLAWSRWGRMEESWVEQVMEALRPKDRQLLELFYWQERSVAEIAGVLGIPAGTVKSRLNTARKHFKDHYSHPEKGDNIMTKLPKIAPFYSIEPISMEPFQVKWEELPGWQIVPRLGEKLNWGLYGYPGGKRMEHTELRVTGKVCVHGIEGVEILAVQYGVEDYYRTGCVDKMERRFAAQLTDSHCRFLAESHEEDGVKQCYTFLDGEAFLNNWGFGPDNCGKETKLLPKGLLCRQGSVITGKEGTTDAVGCYRVTINNKTYDTVCVVDVSCYDDDVASVQYIDAKGRTVLWQRYNRDDWAIDQFGGKLWSEKLPENDRLTINGKTYVHWYDCISDYIL